MFGFGLGEMAAINGVIAGLRAVNELVAQAKEAGSSAVSISGIVGRFTDLDGQIRQIEERSLRRPMTVKESAQISIAKRQCATAMQNIKDAMLMSGNMATYKEMMDRVEESRAQWEKQIAQKKKAAQARRKLMREVAQWALIGVLCFGLTMAGLWAWLKTRH